MDIRELERLENQLRPCGHCGQRAGLDVAQAEPLYRALCRCGIQTAWGSVEQVLALWNYRQIPPEQIALREFRGALKRMLQELSGELAKMRSEPLPPAMQLTTSLMPEISVVHESPGHYRVTAGERWEICSADEVLWVFSNYLHGKMTGYLRTQEEHNKWEAYLNRPREEELFDEYTSTR